MHATGKNGNSSQKFGCLTKINMTPNVSPLSTVEDVNANAHIHHDAIVKMTHKKFQTVQVDVSKATFRFTINTATVKSAVDIAHWSSSIPAVVPHMCSVYTDMKKSMTESMRPLPIVATNMGKLKHSFL